MAAPTFLVGTMASGTGDVTPTLTTNVSGDVILLLVETAIQAVATPSGYAITPCSPQDNAANSRLSAFWKYSNGSESNPLITDPGDHAIVHHVIVSGCDQTDPFDTVVGIWNAGSVTAVVLPGYRTRVADTASLMAVSWHIDNAGPLATWGTNTDLTGFAEIADLGGIDGNGGGITMASGTKAVAGTVGVTQVTYSTGAAFGAITFVFRPPQVTSRTASTLTTNGQF